MVASCLRISHIRRERQTKTERQRERTNKIEVITDLQDNIPLFLLALFLQF